MENEIRIKICYKEQRRTLYIEKQVKTPRRGTSLVAQWLRICLPMQGTQVRSLVQEDPTCHGATKPASHSY